VAGLSTNSNIGLLAEQIREFRPDFACVTDPGAAALLRTKLKASPTRLFQGDEGLDPLIESSCIDEVLVAISGSSALRPLLKAVERSRTIALANKEALVMAGHIIMERARVKKALIIPVDSEQSAIWQCLHGQDSGRLKNIYLTASGGPFRKMPKSMMRKVSIKSVLKHPRWKMGRKITVDSATLMNKGLEVLEAMHLFGVGAGMIKVVIHPEAIIHSMVEFTDGVVMAQLSATDMRIPIQYAFSAPDRIPGGLPCIDFYKIKSFNFGKPDLEKFPCLGLAYEAARQLGTVPCALNAANEISVDAFLNGRLDFCGIPRVVEKVLKAHKNVKDPGLEDIMAADSWARICALKAINKN